MKASLLFCLLLSAFFSITTANAHVQPPVIAIIVDDIGERYAEGSRLIAIDGKLTLAFLPQNSHTRELALAADRVGKEIMLHQPMQATNGKPQGRGAIYLETDESEFKQKVGENLDELPNVRGVNNHMGSLLTQHPGHMTWLMDVIRQRGELYFIDSRTTAATVGAQMAAEAGLLHGQRDVFLDNLAEENAIRQAFEKLIQLARQNGSAIGIGHPYPETVAFLEKIVPRLEEDHGVELLFVSELLAQRQLAAKENAASASKAAAP